MLMMPAGWATWLKGLIAAFVGGGASSVVSGLSAIGIAPESFNFTIKLGHTLELMGVTFLISGITHVMFYLSKSPVPNGG